MNLIRVFLLATLQVLCLCSFSQKQSVKFRRLGTEQGLSQSNVICMLQDSRGFMWFGTRDGLNKYDGYKFTVYKNNSHDPGSLVNNFIRDIAEDKDGNLWIATSGGVSRYDREKDRFTSYKHNVLDGFSLSHNFALSILVDSQDLIWVGTEDGLNVLDAATGKFTRYMHNPNDMTSISDRHIRTIFEDSRNNIWVGTFNGGLNWFGRQTKKFTRFVYDPTDSTTLSNNNVYTIFEDSKHRFWIGTDGGGLNLFNRVSGRFSHYKKKDNADNTIAANSVYAINEDTENNIWLGSENGGLNIFNPESGIFQTYQYDKTNNASLSNNSVYSIYRDTKGNMWVGTFNGGVNLLTPEIRRFGHYKREAFENSLSDDNVLCIYEDSKKKIWIGTDGGGLNLFDPVTGHFTHYRHEKNNPNSICGDYVLSVQEDSKGNLWIGTWGGGVTVFNKAKNTYRHFKNNPADASSLSSNNAWVIYEDRDKNIWIGSFGGGLNLFDPATNSFTRYEYSEKNKASVSGNKIHAIYEDSDGELWISTSGWGLNVFNKKTKKFSHFFHSDENSNSISNNNIGTIYEDRNKNIWFCTMDGLSSYNKNTGRFTNYTTADGLPNNVIFGILEDDKGNFWLSTNKGISCFDPVKKTCRNYGISDGLQSNEFKQKAYCKSYNGQMYFGGINGFNQFHPDSIKLNSFDPPLVITGFQVFNKEVAISNDTLASPLTKSITETKEITIPYKNSVISFEFASINYVLSEKKSYQYMLEGFDTKWNDIGGRRTATYTNLDPGTYIFKVRGVDSDGNWSEKETTLKVIITPPFWLTWWFRTLVVLFVISILAVIYRIRVSNITKQKEKLERQVKLRTDEILQKKEEMRKNVEELERLKEDLLQEKYFLDSLMSNMPDSIYFKDKDSRLMRVSRYMAERFGGTVESLIGKSDFDFQHENHAKEAFEDEKVIMETRVPKVDYVEKEIWSNGSEHWVSTTKMPLLNGRGEVMGTFGISRDVTKAKMLEQERQAAMMEKALAQGKFEIASSVMHDIGNAVVGFGSYLTRIRRMQEGDKMDKLQQLTGYFDENKKAIAGVIGEDKARAIVQMLCSIGLTQRSNNEEINKAITEQFNIIGHIQEILNIQRQYVAGHESQERKAVNIRAVINDSLSMVFASLDKLAIDVKLNIAPDLPIIKGDRTKLMQVFLNLLKNSIESINKDADNKVISIDGYMQSGRMVLQIRDSGDGFDKATSETLFKKGFTTKPAGNGLGLYNCRSIIESHDGSIDITSEGPGKGASATIGFRLSA
jgi:PAS domain S-box-containing protein